VLHTALQNHPGVTTHSEGEEPNRRVVIMLAGERAEESKGERNAKADRSERGDKPSSSRRRRSRRGRRGPKNPQQTGENAAVETAAQDAPVDVLGE